MYYAYLVRSQVFHMRMSCLRLILHGRMKSLMRCLALKMKFLLFIHLQALKLWLSEGICLLCSLKSLLVLNVFCSRCKVLFKGKVQIFIQVVPISPNEFCVCDYFFFFLVMCTPVQYFFFYSRRKKNHAHTLTTHFINSSFIH